MSLAEQTLAGATESADAPVVAVEGLVKRYGDHAAVDGVSFSVRQGEFFALLGASGCGKTTTLRAIGGFVAPDAGAIRIAGVDVAAVPPHRRNVNTVFQSYALFPHMSVADNVAFGLQEARRPKGEIRERVAHALELVRLADRARQRPRQLSGGQQQRVALARALVNRPAVLLLDEPLGALDLKLRREMQLELKAIQRDVGISFVHVTHDQEEALSLSDRIGIMADGRLLQVGAAAEIYERPDTRAVADFVGSSSFLPGAVAGREDGAVVMRLACGETVRARSVAPDVGAADALLCLRPEAVDVRREAPDGVNRVPVRVVEAVYEGHAIATVLALADGTCLRARRHNRPRAPDAALGVGEDGWACWTSDAGRVLPRTADPEPSEEP